MSSQLISRSADLTRLRDEGYELEVRGGFLLVRHVPYVTPARKVGYGVLVSTLSLAGDVTTRPDDHVVMFAGETPCDAQGAPLSQIINSSGRQELLPDLVVDYRFSSKPEGGYPDYYDKISAYANILSSPAQLIEPSATALTFGIVAADEATSVFKYIDTASSRAGIDRITARLALGAVAIVGLGGTGSYILDLIAKTPIREIHLFDGDVFGQHNAFRAPGAPSIDELRERSGKAAYFAERYGQMRRNIVAHGHIDASTVNELRAMDFVFVAVDKGSARRLAVAKLEEFDIPFIDVGMGVYEVEGQLAGVLRVTTSTELSRNSARPRLPVADDDGDNDYSRNIQIADLNALNAALAVIKWKKLQGFYNDLEHEHATCYQIDGNALTNEDQG